MKKTIIIALSALLVLASCGSTASVDAGATAPTGTTAEKSSAKKESAADKNLYKGAGLVIAVTAPEVRNGGKAEAWMPQFFQDSITGNFAKYSKMTVLDRANENLTKAEQELSETGWYTEEDAVQLGQMTNAQYAVFGSITAIYDSYELNFRAIDITTNEIRAAYNDRATAADIENGNAVREVTQNLLEGLGIQLSDKEKQQLAKTDAKSVNATKSLAKGAAAEKADNLIEALAFYAEAQQNGATKKESTAGIDGILLADATLSMETIANLKARADYEKIQIVKWNKIFADLLNYLNTRGLLIVYDFSHIKAASHPYSAQQVIISGIKAKIVPSRHAFLAAKTVFERWETILQKKENASWVRNVRLPVSWQTKIEKFDYDRSYRLLFSAREEDAQRLKIGLFDNADYRIKEDDISLYDLWNLSNVKSQQRYFLDAKWEEKEIWLSLRDLPDDSELKIEPLFFLSLS